MKIAPHSPEPERQRGSLFGREIAVGTSGSRSCGCYLLKLPPQEVDFTNIR